VTVGATTARLLLAKNPAGWTELLDMLDGGTDPVVIGINARIADGHDPSWLWDVDFERLAGRLVVATGDRRADLAVRLRYAGVEHATVAGPLDALVRPGTATVEYVGNYTAFQDLRRLLARGPMSEMPAGTHESRSVVPALPVPVPGATASRPGVSALRVVVIYPDLLGTYGDGGNGRVLAARAAWRDMAVELVFAQSATPLPEGADLYCIGGGEDGPQVQAAEGLAAGALARAVQGGATVLAVCAGYQLMGTVFPGADGRPHAGVGLLDVETVRGPGRRAVGEVVGEPWAPAVDESFPASMPLDRLTGFENHAGVTRLGATVRPLARVLSGVGNGAGSGTDGARAGRVIGTYLHGPVLARNPTLADLLLALATGTELAALDDQEEQELHRLRLRASSDGSGGSAPGPGARRRGALRRLVRLRSL
jgi:CobQ-like glutamine amidotransferase family enzyme